MKTLPIVGEEEKAVAGRQVQPASPHRTSTTHTLTTADRSGALKKRALAIHNQRETSSSLMIGYRLKQMQLLTSRHADPLVRPVAPVSYTHLTLPTKRIV